MPGLAGWSARNPINVSPTYVDDTLLNFPFLWVVSNNSDLSIALATGYDIRFTDSDGTTLLPYERISWTGGAGSNVNAIFWIKVPSITVVSPPVIYVYYGNANAGDGQNGSAVWNSGYVGVWRTDEASGTSTADDSPSGNTGTVVFPPFEPLGQTGIVNKCATLDSRYGITLASQPSLVGDFTISGWILTGTGGAGIIIMGSATQDLNFGSSKLQFIDGAYGMTSSTSLSISTWQRWTLKRSGTTLSMHVNGIKDAATGAAYSGIYNPSAIGKGRISQATSFKLDEIRLSNVARSDAWIKFEYYNQSSATHESTLGLQELYPWMEHEGRNFTYGNIEDMIRTRLYRGAN